VSIATTLATAVLMLIVLAYVLRMPALQGRLGVSLRAIYELFWPTADLWLPLIDEPIDVAMAGAAISRELKIQYPGYYTLGLRVAKRVPNPVPTPQSKPTLRVSFTQNGKEVKGFDIGPQLQSPWWRAEEWGFEMARFWAPGDLPAHERLTLTASVAYPSEAFAARNGATAIWLQKLSTT